MSQKGRHAACSSAGVPGASDSPRPFYWSEDHYTHRPRQIDLDWLMSGDAGRSNTLYLTASQPEFERLSPVLGGLLISDEVVDLFLPVRFYWVRRQRWLKLQKEKMQSSATSIDGSTTNVPALAVQS